MEPAEALISAELALRDLVREIIGGNWRDIGGLPSNEQLEQRRQGEEKSRQGTQISNDPLEYLYIRELRHVLIQSRSELDGIFRNRRRFEAVIEILADYRNTPFHARNLAWFERDLVTGAAGYISANITQWRNSQDLNYDLDYPQILSVVDEWGNEFGKDLSVRFGATETLANLHIGQTVTVTCRGADSDGRTLSWNLHIGQVQPVIAAPIVAQDRGEVVDLQFRTTPKMVQEMVTISVTLAIAESEFPPRIQSYPGASGYDDVRFGRYAVRRPRHRSPRTNVLS